MATVGNESGDVPFLILPTLTLDLEQLHEGKCDLNVLERAVQLIKEVSLVDEWICIAPVMPNSDELFKAVSTTIYITIGYKDHRGSILRDVQILAFNYTNNLEGKVVLKESAGACRLIKGLLVNDWVLLAQPPAKPPAKPPWSSSRFRGYNIAAVMTKFLQLWDYPEHMGREDTTEKHMGREDTTENDPRDDHSLATTVGQHIRAKKLPGLLAKLQLKENNGSQVVLSILMLEWLTEPSHEESSGPAYEEEDPFYFQIEWKEMTKMYYLKDSMRSLVQKLYVGLLSASFRISSRAMLMLQALCFHHSPRPPELS